MSDQSEPKRPSFSVPLKLMAISVPGLLVGFVLCVMFGWGDGGGAEFLTKIGMVGFGLSLLGLVVSLLWLLWLLVAALIRVLRW